MRLTKRATCARNKKWHRKAVVKRGDLLTPKNSANRRRPPESQSHTSFSLALALEWRGMMNDLEDVGPPGDGLLQEEEEEEEVSKGAKGVRGGACVSLWERESSGSSLLIAREMQRAGEGVRRWLKNEAAGGEGGRGGVRGGGHKQKKQLQDETTFSNHLWYILYRYWSLKGWRGKANEIKLHCSFHLLKSATSYP
jgi:hypothetical protein